MFLHLDILPPYGGIFTWNDDVVRQRWTTGICNALERLLGSPAESLGINIAFEQDGIAVTVPLGDNMSTEKIRELMSTLSTSRLPIELVLGRHIGSHWQAHWYIR